MKKLTITLVVNMPDDYNEDSAQNLLDCIGSVVNNNYFQGNDEVTPEELATYGELQWNECNYELLDSEALLTDQLNLKIEEAFEEADLEWSFEFWGLGKDVIREGYLDLAIGVENDIGAQMPCNFKYNPETKDLKVISDYFDGFESYWSCTEQDVKDLFEEFITIYEEYGKEL